MNGVNYGGSSPIMRAQNDSAMRFSAACLAPEVTWLQGLKAHSSLGPNIGGTEVPPFPRYDADFRHEVLANAKSLNLDDCRSSGHSTSPFRTGFNYSDTLSLRHYRKNPRSEKR